MRGRGRGEDSLVHLHKSCLLRKTTLVDMSHIHTWWDEEGDEVGDGGKGGGRKERPGKIYKMVRLGRKINTSNQVLSQVCFESPTQAITKFNCKY